MKDSTILVKTSPSLFAAEPVCQTQLKKIRKQRDAELEGVRYDKESLMAQVRLDRDRKIADIVAQEIERLDAIRADFVQKLAKVLAEQGKCDARGDAVEATCRTQYNKQGSNQIGMKNLGQVFLGRIFVQISWSPSETFISGHILVQHFD